MMTKKAGTQPDFNYMDKAQKHNADGYGVAWYENGFVNTYKTFNYNQFKGVISALKEHTLVIHLRYATKGNKDYSNIHPFDVPSGVMFHNGTMYGIGNSVKSDSQVLAETISKCDYKYIEDIEPLIEPYVDDKINRLVFFEDNGRVTIMNEDLGITEDGNWYSNDYHLKDEGWCRGGKCKTLTSHTVDHSEVPPKTMQMLREHKVFVYGTLKRGYNNHKHYLKDAILLGKAVTKDNWTMVGEDMPYPYVLEQNDELGSNVVGEVYAVSSKELKSLDSLEGYPTHYTKKQIIVTYADDATFSEVVTMYVKANFKGEYIDTVPIITEWEA